MIAALYVETGGPYFGVEGVDPWDATRDAREYAGPHPVVAHPPCKRWGRYWGGGPSAKVKRLKGSALPDLGASSQLRAAGRRLPHGRGEGSCKGERHPREQVSAHHEGEAGDTGEIQAGAD